MGFFPANAPFGANLTLVAELAMGATLTFGAWLARQGRYLQHAWCQSAVVLVNLAVIALAMVPSFHDRVLPKIPARLNRSFYSVATSHAVAGSLAEIAALYLMLAAGTEVLPRRLRPANLKTAMRRVFVLWWITISLGVATYLRWYVPRLFG